MRSLTPRTLTLACLLAAAPLAGASAASEHTGALDAPMPATFHGPRLTAVLDQVQGVDKGIADAEQGKQITPATAHRMEMRAASISKAADRIAAADRGRIPSARYHQLLHRLDRLDQRLQDDTGNGIVFGNGSDG